MSYQKLVSETSTRVTEKNGAGKHDTPSKKLAQVSGTSFLLSIKDCKHVKDKHEKRKY